MNRYLPPLLIGLVAFATVAAAQSVGLFEPDDRRRHYQKTFAEPALDPATAPAIGPTLCVDGDAAGFPCDGLDLASFTPIRDFDTPTDFQALGGGLSDIWGWVDPETDDEYVIVGEGNGAGFFRVTDPEAPEYLGELPGDPGAQLIWYDIKVYADHAFIVSESNPSGMKIFDLTRLRDLEPDTSRQFDADAFYPLPVAAHNVAINEETGFAYIVGGNAGLVVPDACRSGLQMVDISEPTSPTFAGCYATEGGPGTAAGVVTDQTGGITAAYVHDTQCVVYRGPDEDHQGREICFNASETQVDIVDVTDKLRPTLISSMAYEGSAYTHQGWLTDDQSVFLLGDEADETSAEHPTRTYLFDVSDLDAPTTAGETGYWEHETDAIDHNMYVVDQLLFQSNYRAGLRVHDLAEVDEGTLDEVAFFDVYPADDAAEFDGTWSNYPFFPSGTIAVSSYDGLFLLRLTPDVAARYGGTPVSGR